MSNSKHTKLTIAFVVAGMAFDGNTLKTKSLGGSETAGLCMAREMAARGHRVYMFSNGTPGSYDGVEYLPVQMWQQFAATTPVDVLIIQRMPEWLQGRTEARLNVLWQHDLAMARDLDAFRGVLWNMDKCILLSDYHADQYREVFDVPENVIMRSRNGIDLDLFNPAEERDRKTIMYCARPERGLDRLLFDVFPKILEEEPEAKLKIATYDNPNHSMFADFYASCNEQIRLNGDRVIQLGALTKEELYRHYSSAGVYAYPGPSPVMPNFAEISCITAMECMAAGLPFVAYDVGALSETLAPGAGTLVPEGEEEGFVRAVLKYMRDDKQFTRASQAGLKAAQELGWDKVAAQWEEEFIEALEERNDCPNRLARHFLRRSDVMAARYLRDKEDLSPELTAIIDNHPVTDYATKEEPVSDYEITAHSCGRLAQLRRWVESIKPRNMLDVACNTGVFSIEVQNMGVEVTGIDANPSALKMARDNERYAIDGSPTFVLSTPQEFAADHRHEFDVVWAGEVLEHVEDPVEFLEACESMAKPGGYVLLTVPYGPWEEGTEIREHLWEFEQHDIDDMIGHKDPELMYQATNFSKSTNSPLGHHYIAYKADHSPVRPIDMDRKIRLQRPRQTVSANLIVGPNSEETLLWNLKSIAPHVDEIVAGDTGQTSELAKDMLRAYGAKIVSTANPLEEGFDKARNGVLAHADMDWVLWIDTDEKLLSGEHIHKYLRDNSFHGYGIRQHHFAVDTSFDPDMPVRLFRRRLYDGEACKFYGAIHEHPELHLNGGPGPVIILSDTEIVHLGYLKEEGRQQRFWRNLPLLRLDTQRYPDRLLQKHFLMRDNMLMVGYILQQNGGHLTEEIRALCKETQDLYRKHFLGKPGYVNIDSLQYYSQATGILGEGFAADFTLRTDKSEGSMVFANREDFLAEITSRAEDAAAPYEKKWY